MESDTHYYDYLCTAQDCGLLQLQNFNKISDFFEIVPKLCSKLTAIEILRECRDFKKFSAHSQPYQVQVINKKSAGRAV